MSKKLLRVLMAAALSAALALALCMPALAEPDNTGSFAAEISLSGVLAMLGGSKNLRLMTVAGGAYTLELSKMSASGSEFWVRAVLAKGDAYYGTVVLGSRSELEQVDALLIECQQHSGYVQLFFSAVPGEALLASAQLPLDLSGELQLSESAETLGLRLRPAESPAEPETTQPPPILNDLQPVTAKVPPGAYLAAIVSVLLLLGILVMAQLYALRLRRVLDSMRSSAAVFLPRKQRPKPSRKPAVKVPPSPPPSAPRPADALRVEASTRVLPRAQGQEEPSPAPVPPPPSDTMPVLSGVKVVPEDERGSLTKRIVVQSEEDAPLAAHSEEARMNAYFLGKVFFTPLEHSFLNVGLRNRDALLQSGGSHLQPLFAPSPRGHVFSLEEDSGNLYLNVHYFAPPSFVVQSALRSACIERIFTLEDKQGNPLKLEEVMGHAILGILPGRTRRSETGYVLTEPGRLMIGDN